MSGKKGGAGAQSLLEVHEAQHLPFKNDLIRFKLPRPGKENSCYVDTHSLGLRAEKELLRQPPKPLQNLLPLRRPLSNISEDSNYSSLVVTEFNRGTHRNPYQDRSPSPVNPQLSESSRKPLSRRGTEYLKNRCDVKLCKQFFFKGRCSLGAHCTMAHETSSSPRLTLSHISSESSEQRRSDSAICLEVQLSSTTSLEETVNIVEDEGIGRESVPPREEECCYVTGSTNKSTAASKVQDGSSSACHVESRAGDDANPLPVEVHRGEGRTKASSNPLTGPYSSTACAVDSLPLPLPELLSKDKEPQKDLIDSVPRSTSCDHAVSVKVPSSPSYRIFSPVPYCIIPEVKPCVGCPKATPDTMVDFLSPVSRDEPEKNSSIPCAPPTQLFCGAPSGPVPAGSAGQISVFGDDDRKGKAVVHSPECSPQAIGPFNGSSCYYPDYTTTTTTTTTTRTTVTTTPFLPCFMHRARL